MGEAEPVEETSDVSEGMGSSHPEEALNAGPRSLAASSLLGTSA